MSGFGIVNTTVIMKKFLHEYEDLEIRGSIYNLLDKDYTSPWSQDLPDDIPMPGINFLFELNYRF